jgi:ATP-dependent DNA helicase RecQ
VAPYLVFQDRVLQDICQRMPMTLEQLSGCHGVGPKKIESFGLELLAIVKAHAISPEVVPASEDSALARAFSLFESSVAFSQVLERIPRSASTVLGYLERWMSQADIDVVRAYGFSLVKTETYDLIAEAFALEGDDRLRPVMDRLQGTVTYQDLRVARAIYRRSREEKLKDVPRQ